MSATCHFRTSPYWWWLLTMVVLCGCAAPVELPPLLPVTTDGFLPVVQQQLADAHKTVADKPASAQANGHLGMVLTLYGQHNAATRSFERARLIEPGEFRWAYYHGVVLNLLGEPTAATRVFQDALTLKRGDLMTSIRLANILLVAGRYDESEALLDNVLKDNPGSPDALLAKGRVRLRKEDLTGALRFLGRALDAGQANADLYFSLAESYRRLGKNDQAARHFALYEHHRNQPRQQHDALMAELQALDVTDAPLINKARRHYARGEHELTVTSLNEALKRNPDSVQAHTALIAIHSELGNFALSDQHFARALALDPTLARLHFNLGVARQREDRWTEAQQAFEQALLLDPVNTASLVHLGQVKEHFGHKDEAMTHYRNALDLDAGFTPARERLTRLLADKNKVKVKEQ